MKKLILFLAFVICTLSVLVSCSGKTCNACNKSCSDKHSYKDGEVILCDDCYKDFFKTKTEVEPEDFFAE